MSEEIENDVPASDEVVIDFDLQELKNEIAAKNNLIIPLDDPILAVATILNSYNKKLDVREQKYCNALKAVYKESAKEFSDKVEQLSDNSIKEASKEFIQYRTVLFISTSIIAVCTLLNMAIFVMRS